MSMVQDANAEDLAKLFYYYREALTRDCKSRHPGERIGDWESAPASERKLMVAAARLALLDLSTGRDSTSPGRKYYATPGEADWGC
jgi:hypothetical protein